MVITVKLLSDMVPSSFALAHARHHDLNQFTAVEILTEILIVLVEGFFHSNLSQKAGKLNISLMDV